MSGRAGPAISAHGARGARRVRRAPARPHDPGRRLRLLAGYLAYPLLALAALGVLVGVVSCVTSATPTSGTRAGGEAPNAPNAANAASAASADAWIPLRSQEPAAILAATRSGALYREAQARGNSDDGARDLSLLGAPALVRALRPANSSAAATEQTPDFYAVPVLNAAGAATDAIELALNPTHTAVREIAIITYSAPRASSSIAQLSLYQALQLVASQRHVAPRAGATPYLVYFALAAQSQDGQRDQPAWSGGGALPADPIWLVPAADGQSYLAGDDGKVYTIAELPQATTP